MLQPTKNPLIPYTQKRLPSGLTLVHKAVDTAPIVAIDFWVHTGAVHDPAPHNGLSHFFEHMFFKGTEKHGVGEMDRIITSLGGYNNAATSLDYTHYFVVLPSLGWREALDVLLDSIRNPLFDPEEIERERSVIVEEIKRHEDNPWSKIYDDFTTTAFAKCAYRNSVLGTKESLETITQDTFFDYLRSRYCPENISLCVVGDIRLDELEERIDETIGVSSQSTFKEIDQTWETIDAPAGTVIKRDVNQSYLLIGYPTPSVFGTRDEYALDLLSMILGEGRSSRLHKRLQDELGIVSSIGCTAWTLKNAAMFLIEAVTEPSNLDRVETEIQNELSRIRESISSDELQKAKSMTHADYAFSNEKAVSIAHTFGYSRVTTDIDHAVHYLDQIEAVTLEELESAYDRFILPERRCEGLLIPKSG